MRTGLLCLILVAGCGNHDVDTDETTAIPRDPTDAETDADADTDIDSDTDTDSDTDSDSTDTDTGGPVDTDTGGPVDTGTPACNLDGARDPALEACDDANACDLDGCAASSCDREDGIALTTMEMAVGVGFDLDDADGDGDPHTGIDNHLGSSSVVNGVLNPMLEDAFDEGSIRLAMSFDVDDPGDDPEIAMSMHAFVDPACPANPVYNAGSPPPWIGAAPAEVYSDSAQFPACEPPARFDEASDPDNGIFPAATPGQPPAPVLVAAGSSLSLDAGAVGTLVFASPRIEATVVHDGTTIQDLANGVLGGTVSPAVLFRMPGTDALCPTALHAVLGHIGQPDIDVDATGLDAIDVNFGVLPCLVTAVTIDGCIDGETGALIADSATDGDCTLDPAITDGYSAGARFTGTELHVVEQVDGAAFCP